MATPPPKKKTEISESEVIDPHLRITFPLPKDSPGWTSWTAQNIEGIINNLRVQLTYKDEVFINHNRGYDKANFQFIHAPFNPSEFDDNVSYYNTTPHYLTLYIHFPDPDFHLHTENEWLVTARIDMEPIGNYREKLIPYQPKRFH